MAQSLFKAPSLLVLFNYRYAKLRELICALSNDNIFVFYILFGSWGEAWASRKCSFTNLSMLLFFVLNPTINNIHVLHCFNCNTTWKLTFCKLLETTRKSKKLNDAMSYLDQQCILQY